MLSQHSYSKMKKTHLPNSACYLQMTELLKEDLYSHGFDVLQLSEDKPLASNRNNQYWHNLFVFFCVCVACVLLGSRFLRSKREGKGIVYTICYSEENKSTGVTPPPDPQ